MAAETVSLDLLGEQMKRIRADIRDLKGRVLLVESDQGELRRDLARVETKVDVLAERTDDRFDQLDQRFVELFRTMAEHFAGVRQDILELRTRP